MSKLNACKTATPYNFEAIFSFETKVGLVTSTGSPPNLILLWLHDLVVVTNTQYMEFELSFKQEHLLDYNISLNSFRFSTQKTAHRTKSEFPSQKTGVTYKADDLELQDYDKNSHPTLAIFFTLFRKEKC